MAIKSGCREQARTRQHLPLSTSPHLGVVGNMLFLWAKKKKKKN